MTSRFPNKFTQEKLVLGFDLSAELASGETLTAVTQTIVTVLSGTDATPNDLLNGAATISDGVISQPVKDGIAGVDYQIKQVCSTSNSSKVLAIIGKLLVL